MWYSITGPDNDSYAFSDSLSQSDTPKAIRSLAPSFSGSVRQGLSSCKSCGEILNKWDCDLEGLVIRKRKFDVSCTYDGITVVSAKFKAACEKAQLTGLSFYQLPSDQVFFSIMPTKMVYYDVPRSKVRFEKQCTTCGAFESVIGPTPVILEKSLTIMDLEFARTNLEFGTAEEKSPLILCGETAAMVLRKAKLVGLDIEAM